jgi:hypothetical protein
MSVTEREITKALSDKNKDKSMLWFKRTFTDIDKAENSTKLKKYYGNFTLL